MSEIDAKPPQENPLTNIIVNVLIPIAALTMMSDDPAIREMDGDKVRMWDLGPMKALCLALALPSSSTASGFSLSTRS